MTRGGLRGPVLRSDERVRQVYSLGTGNPGRRPGSERQAELTRPLERDGAAKSQRVRGAGGLGWKAPGRRRPGLSEGGGTGWSGSGGEVGPRAPSRRDRGAGVGKGSLVRPRRKGWGWKWGLDSPTDTKTCGTPFRGPVRQQTPLGHCESEQGYEGGCLSVDA